MRRINEPTFMHLTANHIRKLEIVQKSITEPVTRREIISGLIDGAYAVALKDLYQDQLISKRDYEKLIAQIPDYILDAI